MSGNHYETPLGGEPTFSVSDFVAVCNQTLEFAYPSVVVVGELANYRVSRKRWVHFDLKDAGASVSFFGSAQQLPGPLENGLLLRVRGVPRLHQQYGFSITVQFMQPVGKGSIKKAGDLLAAKLQAEGLFDADRKRSLPYPPQRIGLITSGESAAYRDFTKILADRWRGVRIIHADVQVQGEAAGAQIARAVEHCNEYHSDIGVLVITRGGGSADDLAVYNTERVVRAVAASRIPTLVAIGHEVDVSLAGLAADVRASTPSNAAEVLVPDRIHVMHGLHARCETMTAVVSARLRDAIDAVRLVPQELQQSAARHLQAARDQLDGRRALLSALDPQAALRRGYAIVRSDNRAVRSAAELQPGQRVGLTLQDGTARAIIEGVE
ncbi:exodeoxyribonuclease VII large subunit [Candidatus Saccharibacteria bacterium]|nr:MAG: exodeoxyribonuclease VII large subunit [Candidatus Saccharibacteria bacterium]